MGEFGPGTTEVSSVSKPGRSSQVVEREVERGRPQALALPTSVDEQAPEEVRTQVLGKAAGNAVAEHQEADRLVPGIDRAIPRAGGGSRGGLHEGFRDAGDVVLLIRGHRQ